MLERGAIWTLTDLYRSIRLQGKHPVDAVNDPDLNLQIQAWEMMSPGAAVDFWERCYHQTPRVDPGFRGFMEWREIADGPADEAEAKRCRRLPSPARPCRLARREPPASGPKSPSKA